MNSSANKLKLLLKLSRDLLSFQEGSELGRSRFKEKTYGPQRAHCSRGRANLEKIHRAI